MYLKKVRAIKSGGRRQGEMNRQRKMNKKNEGKSGKEQLLLFMLK